MMLLDDTVAEFGRSLGMEDLRLREDGATVIDIESIGSLAMEVVGERKEHVVISLSRRIEPPDERACLEALALCHYRAGGEWPVYPAWAGGQLLFAVRLDFSEFTLQSIHEIITTLTRLQDAMSSVVRAA